MEGSSLDGKSSQGRKGNTGSGASSGGSQGTSMADALAEMTKRYVYADNKIQSKIIDKRFQNQASLANNHFAFLRSSYFQQIEEDVKNHAESIKEVRKNLTSFQATDMNELLKFHRDVESHLEKLTDESQV